MVKSNRYSINHSALRWISGILIFVLLVTSNTLSICAISDQIQESIAYSIASIYSGNLLPECLMKMPQFSICRN